MSPDEAEEDESYWPGYVDAIINVVLNILFMVAVFVVALSTLDLKSATPNPVSSSPVAAAMAQGHASHVVEEIQIPSKRLAVPTAAASRFESDWLVRHTAHGADVFRIDFRSQEMSMPGVLPPQLGVALGEASLRPSQDKWLIWAGHDDASGSQARITYLRVLSAREHLIQAGVLPHNIQTRILSLPVDHADLMNRIWIARQPQG